jgi:hypothetical protein
MPSVSPFWLCQNRVKLTYEQRTHSELGYSITFVATAELLCVKFPTSLVSYYVIIYALCK